MCFWYTRLRILAQLVHGFVCNDCGCRGLLNKLGVESDMRLTALWFVVRQHASSLIWASSAHNSSVETSTMHGRMQNFVSQEGSASSEGNKYYDSLLTNVCRLTELFIILIKIVIQTYTINVQINYNIYIPTRGCGRIIIYIPTRGCVRIIIYNYTALNTILDKGDETWYNKRANQHSESDVTGQKTTKQDLKKVYKQKCPNGGRYRIRPRDFWKRPRQILY